jgi:CRP-like cAMP-binding protein
MLLHLHHNFERFPTLSEEEFSTICAYSVRKRVRKRHFLLQEGDACRSFIWVTKGSFCLFIGDGEGKDHIIDFALEREAITDYLSMSRNEPSCYCIEAIEDSEVIILDQPSFEKLCRDFPQIMKMVFQKQIAQYQMRITFMITMTAEEKYKTLMHHRPTLSNRVPQHMIASYLGITPTTLSRLRRHRGLSA